MTRTHSRAVAYLATSAVRTAGKAVGAVQRASKEGLRGAFPHILRRAIRQLFFSAAVTAISSAALSESLVAQIFAGLPGSIPNGGQVPPSPSLLQPQADMRALDPCASSFKAGTAELERSFVVVGARLYRAKSACSMHHK